MCSTRVFWLRLVLLGAFLMFAGRLGYLQLVRGAELRAKSEHNFQRWVRLPAPRGRILDRQGRPLATSTPAVTAWLVRSEVPQGGWGPLRDRLQSIGIFPDRATADQAQQEFSRYPKWLPLRLKSRLTMAMITRLEEERALLPGIYLWEEPVRRYPGGTLAAHLLGYLREIDAGELKDRRSRGYYMGDRIGKAGLERVYEDTLRGREGGQQVEVDADGRVLRTLRREPSTPGEELTLTLDLRIQQAAEAALRGHRGAVVVLDPANGDILALASAPTYDLNQMSGRISPQMLAWLRSPQRPELNRAAAGLYPPGSVFKIVTAAAAVEKGVVPPNAYFYCDGVYHGIHCWKHSGHGAINLTEAIAHSCNVAFMKMAESTGIDDLTAMADRFGLGASIDLTGVSTAAGVVPTPAWARRVHHRSWQLGETLQVGIGQSALMVTPLQSARVAAAIANGGKLVHPRLVANIGDLPVAVIPPTSLGLRPQTVTRLQHGLRAVVGEGTARQLDPTLRIAGKTGTAQHPGGEDHAWFAGYAPADAPRVAVAVLIENGGHGGTIAAPIAEKVIRAALDKGQQ